MTQAERRREEKRVRILRDGALRKVMSTEAGQDTLWRILTVSGLFSDDFDTDSRLHARNAGRRSVGLDLMREIQRVAPQSWLELTNRRIGAEMLALNLRNEPEREDEG